MDGRLLEASSLLLLVALSGSCAKKDGHYTEIVDGEVGWGEYRQGRREGAWGFMRRSPLRRGDREFHRRGRNFHMESERQRLG